MNLASNTAPVSSTRPSNVAAIQPLDRMELLAVPLADTVAGLAFVPGPVEVLGHEPELNNQFAERSSGSASPRFSCQSRIKAASSSPMMITGVRPADE